MCKNFGRAKGTRAVFVKKVLERIEDVRELSRQVLVRW
jgi:hypothetical protein